jgi:hypothetical protein
MLYVLQQQVREIQEELSKLEPGKSGGAKKVSSIFTEECHQHVTNSEQQNYCSKLYNS